MGKFTLEEESDESRSRQTGRRERYAGIAAERLQATMDCQFSLLPYQELARTAGAWFDAVTESLLRANYGPLDEMIRAQVRVAADQGFELDDILQLLRLFRAVAIKEEGWNEEQFGELDVVIDEALQALRGQVAWSIPEGLNYLTGESLADRELTSVGEQKDSERRRNARNKLRLPIRVKTYLPVGAVDEITRTENVARGGIYFVSKNPFYKDVRVHVQYPFWEATDAINPEYQAEVVRIDDRGEYKGIALRFLTDLRSQKKSPS
ncbi:MAG: PilZ domain-containing protein [Candidatus Acidiferrales bacterium]